MAVFKEKGTFLIQAPDLFACTQVVVVGMQLSCGAKHNYIRTKDRYPCDAEGCDGWFYQCHGIQTHRDDTDDTPGHACL